MTKEEESEKNNYNEYVMCVYLIVHECMSCMYVSLYYVVRIVHVCISGSGSEQRSLLLMSCGDVLYNFGIRIENK